MSSIQPDPNGGFLDTVMHWAPVGAAASLIRALLSQNPGSYWWIARRTVAASITAALVGPAILAQSPNSGLAMACVGAVSYAAPEVWDWVGKKAVSLFKSVFKA